MSVIWKKVWRDLAHNKARTLLVVLSTAVGVFALGLVFGLSGVLRAQILDSHRAAVPAHITFWGGPFSPGTVEAIGREPGVGAAEGETAASFRWKLEGEEEWRDGGLVARADYDAQRMNRLRLLGGRWPDDQVNRLPSERALSVERLSSRYFGVSTGTTILVEFGERERCVPVEGVVSAPVVLSPEWGGDAMFFATPETAAWASGDGPGESFGQLNVILESYSEAGAEEAAGRIEDRLERMGLPVGGYEISDPNEHWVQDIVDATTVILMVMGVLSLGLSAFLIVNTVNGILVQQRWQIGVMKAIGATFGRVVRVCADPGHAHLQRGDVYGGPEHGGISRQHHRDQFLPGRGCRPKARSTAAHIARDRDRRKRPGCRRSGGVERAGGDAPAGERRGTSGGAHRGAAGFGDIHAARRQQGPQPAPRR